MKVIILGSGTSQGVPVIGCKCKTCLSTNPKDKRLRTSVYIEANGSRILIDTSSDFRQQMLANNIDDLDAVLYTHHHVDHILGMDDLRQINQQQNKYISLFGNRKTMSEISATFRYIFDERLIAHKAVPLVSLHGISNEPFHFKETKITPVEVIHGRLPIFGYRIGNFAYITDASRIEEYELEKLKGLDVLVVNALRIREHPTHFNIQQATELSYILKPKQTFLTHTTHEVMYNEVNPFLPDGIDLAYDGLTFEIED